MEESIKKTNESHLDILVNRLEADLNVTRCPSNNKDSDPFIRSLFTLGEKPNKGALVAAAVPGAAMVVGSVVSYIACNIIASTIDGGVKASTISYDDYNRLFNMYNEFMKMNHTTYYNILPNVEIFLAAVAASTPLKIIKENKASKGEFIKSKKREERIAKHSIVADLACDYQNDKKEEDRSLHIMRYIMENIDISRNSTEFDFELLSRVAAHREAKKNNDHKEIIRTSRELISFLEKAKTRKGASILFVDSDGVQNLIDILQDEIAYSKQYRKEKKLGNR